MDLLKRYAQPAILLVGFFSVVFGLSALGYQIAENHTSVNGWIVASIIAGAQIFGAAIWIPANVEVDK